MIARSGNGGRGKPAALVIGGGIAGIQAALDIAGAGFGTNSNEVNTSWAPGFGVTLLDRLVRDAYED